MADPQAPTPGDPFMTSAAGSSVASGAGPDAGSSVASSAGSDAGPRVDPGLLLDLAVRAAHAAGAELLRRYGHVSGLATKSSETDPVSDADRAAEALLVQMIAAERPGDGVIGEEGAHRASESGITWVLDPLDGTVNYLYQLDNFSVSIAATDAMGGVVGVVHDVTRKRTFTAVRNGGAACNGKALHVNEPVQISRALVATGFGYDADRRAVQGRIVAQIVPRIRDIRRLGSAALDLCAVASGGVDAYYEIGVNNWDVAAGGLIAEEAGAKMTVFTEPGEPVGYLIAGPSLHSALNSLLSDTIARRI